MKLKYMCDISIRNFFEKIGLQVDWISADIDVLLSLGLIWVCLFLLCYAGHQAFRLEIEGIRGYCGETNLLSFKALRIWYDILFSLATSPINHYVVGYILFWFI